MAVRIVGVDLPQNKRGEIALTYIFGIGRSAAKTILDKAGVDVNIKVQDWTDAQAAKVREVIQENYKVEGDLRSELQLNIKRLMATVSACPCAARAPKTMPVPARDARKQSLTRRRLPNNFGRLSLTHPLALWQRKQSQLKRETLKLMPPASFTFTPPSTISLYA